MQRELHAKVSRNKYPQNARIGGVGAKTYASDPFLRVLTVYFRRAAAATPIRYEIRRPQGKSPHVDLEVFTPKNEKQVPSGTMTRGNATCPACERVLPVERLRVQLREQRGGADVIFDKEGKRVGGTRVLAVVTLKDNSIGRHYRDANNCDYEAVWKVQRPLAKLANEQLRNGIAIIPNESIPYERVWKNNPIRVYLYGMARWGDLFTDRQKLTLATLTPGCGQGGSVITLSG